MTHLLAGTQRIAAEPGDTTAHRYGLAVDIGTTTLVSTLVDLSTGRELATASSLNPQARTAQDVLSRIKLGSEPEGLFVDIGTNGEMVLARNGCLTATSTAAGPAFEGMNITCGMRAGRGAVERVALSDEGIEIGTIHDAEPVGICGSGLLDVVGELAAHGGVDKNGRFQYNGSSPDKPWKDRWDSVDGKPVFRLAGPVFLSQKDVRQVQLAKAAIRLGIELMLKENGLTPAEVDRVLIAGSFGFHLRTESLINLGLLPREFSGRVEFVGNTSRTGAQALLLNHPLRGQLRNVTQAVNVLELARDPAFEKTFIKSLQF